jgi:hypothetical protein
LLDQNLGEWKAPGEHNIPNIELSEIVLFVPFIQHGLGLPAYPFLHGLLHYYGITLNHLNPNSILHLSIFVHFYEIFLGIPPSITLFCYFFKLKPHLDAANPHVLGGAGIQFRLRKKKEYLHYTLVDSVKNWRTEWFYAGNMWPPLEVHSNVASVPNARWEKEPVNAMELEGIRPFLKQLSAMKDQGLNGVGVVANFIRHRVHPLQERAHYVFEYVGPKDPA